MSMHALSLQAFNVIGVSLIALVVAGCASAPAKVPTQFSFAPLSVNAPVLPLKRSPIALAEISAAPMLDGDEIVYRLDYDNAQVLRSYAQHRWSAAPSRMLAQRLKARAAQVGFQFVTAKDGVAHAQVLRIELDDFSHVFSAPQRSTGQVIVRASVINGRLLLAQRSFARSVPSASADAPGGAKALQEATDAVISEMLEWIATLPPNLASNPIGGALGVKP
jgi:cholesterol transport system auxiliary component